MGCSPRIHHPKRPPQNPPRRRRYPLRRRITFPATSKPPTASTSVYALHLETLLHFITHQHLKHAEYHQNATSNRIPAVTYFDRKVLQDYLSGKISTSDSIDFTIIAIPGAGDKIAEISDEDDLTTNPIKWIKTMERPLKDLAQILCCKNRDFYGFLTAATRRDDDRQRQDALQRKDNLVAKSRIERGGEQLGLGLGFGGDHKAKLHLKGSKIGEGSC
ncbi:hypothetical protein ACH5RR_033334 [Cinchona calisaya]|uniref:Paf1 complex subunit Cdc73 N-terminal domain-containing protein n=1 Tax=Cinchona calisaya TaxID=153742 RepID=A0ABD2YNS7_9GENT